MRRLFLSAASAAALACTGAVALAQGGGGSGSSSATITQSGPKGTSTTTRSTNGSQTITRQSGNSSATITQGSGSGSGGKAGARANEYLDDMEDEAAAALGCGDNEPGGKTGAARSRGRGAAIAGAAAGIEACADDESPTSRAAPPKPTTKPERRSQAGPALERRMDPAGRLPALDAQARRLTGRDLGAARSLRRIVRQATN